MTDTEVSPDWLAAGVILISFLLGNCGLVLAGVVDVDAMELKGLHDDIAASTSKHTDSVRFITMCKIFRSEFG